MVGCWLTKVVERLLVQLLILHVEKMNFNPNFMASLLASASWISDVFVISS